MLLSRAARLLCKIAWLSSKAQGMRAGQKVRLKAASPLKQRLNLPPEALGAVLCSYRVLRGADAAVRRLDVRFSSDLIIWGAPDDQFEPVEDASEASEH
jgi:hypothetical protein